jgi:hypothetical protein
MVPTSQEVRRALASLREPSRTRADSLQLPFGSPQAGVAYRGCTPRLHAGIAWPQACLGEFFHEGSRFSLNAWRPSR